MTPQHRVLASRGSRSGRRSFGTPHGLFPDGPRAAQVAGYKTRGELAPSLTQLLPAPHPSSFGLITALRSSPQPSPAQPSRSSHNEVLHRRHPRYRRGRPRRAPDGAAPRQERREARQALLGPPLTAPDRGRRRALQRDLARLVLDQLGRLRLHHHRRRLRHRHHRRPHARRGCLWRRQGHPRGLLRLRLGRHRR